MLQVNTLKSDSNKEKCQEEKSVLQLKCDQCGKIYSIKYKTHNARKQNKRPNLCSKCMSSFRSNTSKNYWKRNDNFWNSLNDEEKKLRLEKAHNGNKKYYDNMTPEEKANKLKARLDGYKKWLDTLSDDEKRALIENRTEVLHDSISKRSDEEKRKISLLLSKRSKEYWKQFSSEERKKLMEPVIEGRQRWWNSLSDEEHKKKIDSMTKKFIEYWDKRSEEEKDYKMSLLHSGLNEWWNSLSNEEKTNRINKLNKGNEKWYQSLSDDEKKLFNDKSIRNLKRYWDEITPEEYKNWYEKRINSYNKYMNKLNDNPNNNESSFMDILKINKINYQWQYYNQTIHSDFDKLFTYNPVTKSDLVSPYHQWDFIIHTNDGDVLVDIDGSIHDILQTGFEVTNSQGKQFILADYIQFNDSKRPYQTDGLPAYAVLCYDDNITNDTLVVNINTGELMNLKSFISLLDIDEYIRRIKEE